MTQSAKAAWIALGIIVSLTGAKFILYYLSGSISVLSDAWHSFSDIATTLLVLISIIRQGKKDSASVHPADEANTKATSDRAVYRWYKWFRRINTELKVSFAIGLVLCVAALTIAWRAFTVPEIEITRPLVTGIIFIVLSFGSYFLYRFEESMGRSVNSAALAADSHHNQADMATSLLAGISLIIYHFGINVDRWVGLFIAVYILAFSSELLVNTIQSIRHNQVNVVINVRFTAILWQLFQVNTYRNLFRWIDSHFRLGAYTKKVLKTIPSVSGFIFKWSIRLATVAGLIIYLSTMFYTVKADEKALCLRFNKLPHGRGGQPKLPGLHIKWPYPIDRVIRFQTEKINSVPVGNTSGQSTPMIWTREHGDDRSFISGDNNLFLPYIVVHYRIKNVRNYYLTHRDGIPEKVLRANTTRLLNQIFAENTFYDLALGKREAWTRECQRRLQQASDKLKMGLEVIDFCLKDMHPPIQLADAYEDVVAAHQLRDKHFNEAERRVAVVLSGERIKAMKTISEAQSYVTEKVNLAEGEAENYLLRYSGYEAGKETLRNLLLLEAAQDTLKGKTLYLVDPNSGIDEKLIYIENYMMGGKSR